jgi:hypothetical protein
MPNDGNATLSTTDANKRKGGRNTIRLRLTIVCKGFFDTYSNVKGISREDAKVALTGAGLRKKPPGIQPDQGFLPTYGVVTEAQPARGYSRVEVMKTAGPDERPFSRVDVLVHGPPRREGDDLKIEYDLGFEILDIKHYVQLQKKLLEEVTAIAQKEAWALRQPEKTGSLLVPFKPASAYSLVIPKHEVALVSCFFQLADYVQTVTVPFPIFMFPGREHPSGSKETNVTAHAISIGMLKALVAKPLAEANISREALAGIFGFGDNVVDAADRVESVLNAARIGEKFVIVKRAMGVLGKLTEWWVDPVLFLGESAIATYKASWSLPGLDDQLMENYLKMSLEIVETSGTVRDRMSNTAVLIAGALSAVARHDIGEVVSHDEWRVIGKKTVAWLLEWLIVVTTIGMVTFAEGVTVGTATVVVVILLPSVGFAVGAVEAHKDNEVKRIRRVEVAELLGRNEKRRAEARAKGLSRLDELLGLMATLYSGGLADDMLLYWDRGGFRLVKDIASLTPQYLGQKRSQVSTKLNP